MLLWLMRVEGLLLLVIFEEGLEDALVLVVVETVMQLWFSLESLEIHIRGLRKLWLWV